MFAFIVLAVFSGVCYGVPVEQFPGSPRIHGGQDADPDTAPHMVALLSGTRVVCGGTIVSERHVLTAAHCVTPFLENEQLVPTFHGRVGSTIWKSGGTLVYFEGHNVHPQWNEDTIKFDLAILTLTQHLEFNKQVAMVKLDFSWVAGNEDCSVTGWGTTWPKIDETIVHLAPTPDNLQVLFTKTMDFELCTEMLNSRPYWASIIPYLDQNIEICTFHSVSYGNCHGDSGSGLISLSSGKLIGVVSWGIPCAAGAPDMYARVAGAKPFFDDILGTSE